MKNTKARLVNRAKAGHLKALGNQWLFTSVQNGHYFVARADRVLHEINPETGALFPAKGKHLVVVSH